jgi:parallel beta-helix repeat protein
MPHGPWAITVLYVDTCNPIISGCQITNSETHGIELWSSKATITNNTFANMGSGGYPISFKTTDTFPVMSGNSTSGTGENGIALPGGAMSVSGTWNRPGVNFPYLLNGSPDVSVGTTLTIDPGNTFKSIGEIGLYINGTLNAPGTGALPVIFTSRSATPAAGNWRGIYLAPTATITAMSYVTIDYAGGYFGAGTDSM